MPRKVRLTLYATPIGFTSRCPAVLPPIDRGALMRCAHQVAKRMRSHFGTYREALAYGLAAAWQRAKVAQTFRSLRAQVAPVQHTAAQIEASRQATRRTGSSLWAS
jgi:hypothetical protein